MCGTTDLNREYHPYCIMITQHEEQEDYSYLFQTLKYIVETIHPDQEFNPTVLLADTASAITNGFANVFTLIHRIFCWAHVKRAIDAKLNSVTNKDIRNKIISDIVNFQHYVETETFTDVACLMVDNWREIYRDNEQVERFITYFIKQWLSPKRMGWYDHYIPHVPCQDNALESTNRYIKDNSFRKRLSINEFLHSLENGKYS